MPDRRIDLTSNSDERQGYIKYCIDDNVCTINTLFIFPDHRDQGLGSQLLNAVTNESILNGVQQIEGEFLPLPDDPDNDKKLRKFYASHGFEIGEGETTTIRKRLV